MRAAVISCSPNSRSNRSTFAGTRAYRRCGLKWKDAAYALPIFRYGKGGSGLLTPLPAGNPGHEGWGIVDAVGAEVKNV